jgi:hypothetical protein
VLVSCWQIAFQPGRFGSIMAVQWKRVTGDQVLRDGRSEDPLGNRRTPPDRVFSFPRPLPDEFPPPTVGVSRGSAPELPASAEEGCKTLPRGLVFLPCQRLHVARDFDRAVYEDPLS